MKEILGKVERVEGERDDFLMPRTHGHRHTLMQSPGHLPFLSLVVNRKNSASLLDIDTINDI